MTLARKTFSAIDRMLDSITMYRLALYVLTGLVVAAIAESALGILHYSVSAIVLSTILALAVCWGVNQFFVSWLKAAPSVESVYITAFILVLILPPAKLGDTTAALTVVVASALAMASKYVFAYQKKHFFNPAAFGVAVTGIGLGWYASWWAAGNIALLPFVLVGGLALVRKIRRFDMVLTFIIVALGSIVLTTPAASPLVPLQFGLLHTSLLFFAFIMLTEPLTAPLEKRSRFVYAALTGMMFAPAFHVGAFYFSPELALLTANLFAFVVSPKGRHLLTLLRVEETSVSAKDFVFSVDRPITFAAGQYLEWTLPHQKPDTRGTRRYFTIASAPTEKEVRLGVKFYPKGSSFKEALSALTPNDTIVATSVAGSFVLPKDKKIKLVFMAGGIGITPFRSQVQYLVDTNDRRSVTLFYSNRNAFEVAYRDVLTTAAEKIGLKTVYAYTEPKAADAYPDVLSSIDAASIRREVPQYRDCLFYLSGPNAMVTAFEQLLLSMGVPRWHIKKDFFPGFA